jgi:hypothetical protein
MLTRTANSIFAKTSGSVLLAPKSIANTRLFSSSVTYDFKDLILDPEAKNKPLYQLHRLEEA